MHFSSVALLFLVQVWEETFGVNIREAARKKSYDPGNLAHQLSQASSVVKKIGFIGLGAMGFGMAAHLLKSGFTVVAYDVSLYLSLNPFLYYALDN